MDFMLCSLNVDLNRLGFRGDRKGLETLGEEVLRATNL